ncbi:unnamed protein product [Adineta steineri]|uniref:NAD(P)(+)--arginine ADP-ribosyltransferase n=1 Tax=Adineta steineri TaxID=433720 RepID=A0A815CXB9_9BILA|nr:unnamed protein product [Adineta steineri]CAF3597601.1 unnamed protein product [Adineta steineri]
MGNHISRLKRRQPQKPAQPLPSVQPPTQVQLPSSPVNSRNFDRCPESSSEFAYHFKNPLPPRRFYETIILVWLDSRIDDAVVDTRVTKNMLGALTDNDSLHVFTDTTECHEFLIQRRDTIEPIFLIISGQCSQELFSKLDQRTYKMIDSIFIFCLNEQTYKFGLNNHEKIIGIYTEQIKLIEAIDRQLQLLRRYNFLIKFYDDTQKTARNIFNDEDSIEFFWHRMFKETLLRFPQTESAKKLMIDRCRLLYRFNPAGLKQIDEFDKTYTPADALKWYTRDSFLYRKINQAMRTEDTDELFTFRYFIIDLCHALKEKKFTPIANKVFLLYRGLSLPSDKIKEFQWSEGHLISINSFFSATWQREVAESFACVGTSTAETNTISIIFEIEIDSSCDHQTIFADLRGFSYNPYEEEVLFDFATVFRIRKITFNDQQNCLSIRLVTDNKWQESVNQTYTRFSELQTKMPYEFAYVGDLINAGEARHAHLEANNYMDMLSTTLTLWNICHVHAVYSLNSKQKNSLERYMYDSFDIFELGKRLRGGSDDNHYRDLLTYAERIAKNREQSVEISLCQSQTTIVTNIEEDDIIRL